MDEWEDIDENETDEEETEEEILEYCDECGNPIYDGEEYAVLQDGRVLCENCQISMNDESRIR